MVLYYSSQDTKTQLTCAVFHNTIGVVEGAYQFGGLSMHGWRRLVRCSFLWFLFLLCRPRPSPRTARSDPDSACILCHLDNDAVLTLPSGELIHADVDFSALEQSVHGMHATENVQCTDCHRNGERYQYPHAPNPAQDLANLPVKSPSTCVPCHADSALHNPGHEGVTDNPNVPTCVDCHGGHDTQPANTMAAAPVATCQTLSRRF